MSYQSEIAKTEMGGAAELYEVTTGNQIVRYTSWPASLIFETHTFNPASIQRSQFALDTDFKLIHVTLTAPLVAPLTRYIANAPIEPTFIKIWRSFVDDLTAFRLLFQGEIKTVTLKDNVARVAVESLSNLFRTKLPRFVYQSHCNHRLFDSGCTLNAEDFRVNGAVTVSGSDLVSAAFAAKPDEYFTAGYVRYDTDIRLITDHVGSTITIQAPFDSRVFNGVTVAAYPGDNKAAATCRDKFANLENFLGMPYIPSKNPVIFGF
ncbi:DUF2163 domain-containing protein [Candidatus Pacearchaeota archaeon]|nr:DUF2163 domain-containing protein [Candidatus Pacearchaeota archaeon]